MDQAGPTRAHADLQYAHMKRYQTNFKYRCFIIHICVRLGVIFRIRGFLVFNFHMSYIIIITSSNLFNHHRLYRPKIKYILYTVYKDRHKFKRRVNSRNIRRIVTRFEHGTIELFVAVGDTQFRVRNRAVRPYCNTCICRNRIISGSLRAR